LLAILAPHVSAVLVAALESGTSGVREFYRTVFRRTKVRWVVVAIAAPIAIYLAGYALGAAFEQTAGAPAFHPAQRTLFILLFGQTVVALGEEPGWRGFAQGRLTRLLGAIPGSALLGVGWAVWHLPLFLIEGTAPYGTSFFAFLTTLVAWSTIVTYLVRRARGGAIVAMLFHASANLCDFTVWEPHSNLLAVIPWLLAATYAAWRLRHLKDVDR
jgi:membrane protease YdiL (CAAX protease family)